MDSSPEDERYRKAVARFSIFHMSNAKWRRVFTAIADAGIVSLQSEWKHIDTDEITYKYQMPAHRDLLERRFQDGYFQPYEYRWIHWIRIPRRYFDESVGLTREQDLTALQAALEASRAMTKIDADAITILAYEQ